MSRIGAQPIPIPAGCSLAIGADTVTVKGPKGEIELRYPPQLEVKEEAQEVVVRRKDESARALHGLWRSLIANALQGVSVGFEKRLELVGTGYRVKKEGDKLIMSLGFSHPIVVEPEPGISFAVENEKEVIVRGIDKQRVGQVAASIRSRRPPEPYKGKGFHYQGEVVRRKPGKAAKVGAPQGAA